MNVLAPRGILKDRIAFYHGAFGFCAISTLCSAIDNLSLASLPGQLTSKQVRKHLQFSKPMHQGHLSQEFQGTQSTQSLPTSECLADRSPTKILQRSNLIFASCFQATGKIYGDPTGRFVAQSISGNEYVLVVYNYDANTIHVEAFQSRQTIHIIDAYKKILGDLSAHGISPTLLTI